MRKGKMKTNITQKDTRTIIIYQEKIMRFSLPHGYSLGLGNEEFFGIIIIYILSISFNTHKVVILIWE